MRIEIHHASVSDQNIINENQNCFQTISNSVEPHDRPPRASEAASGSRLPSPFRPLAVAPGHRGCSRRNDYANPSELAACNLGTVRVHVPSKVTQNQTRHLLNLDHITTRTVQYCIILRVCQNLGTKLHQLPRSHRMHWSYWDAQELLKNTQNSGTDPAESNPAPTYPRHRPV